MLLPKHLVLLWQEHFDAHTGDLHAALAHEKEKQSAIVDEQQQAVVSAKEEADKVAQAQLKVQQQLERVNRLENSLKF